MDPIETVSLAETDIDLMAATLPTAWALRARPRTGVACSHDRLNCQNPVSSPRSLAQRAQPRDVRRSQVEDFSLAH